MEVVVVAVAVVVGVMVISIGNSSSSWWCDMSLIMVFHYHIALLVAWIVITLQ